MAKERARTLTLRAVADLLVERGYAGRRDTNGHNKLLALLKCGDLQSVAFFPDVTESPVCLPVEYWAPVGPDALLVLLRQPARRHRGAYKIELRDLAVEVFRVARSSENLDVESLVARLIENAET